MTETMSSNRPYLLRALFEWIIDNGLTPHIVTDADNPRMQAPTDLARQGKLVLNIGPSAVDGLEIDNEWIGFSARFSGRAMDIAVPIEAVLAIYARENGQGMMFAEEEAPDPDGDTPTEPRKGAHLKIVK